MIAIVCLVALAACLGLAYLGACLTDTPNRELAGWIEAVATALALVAAAIAAMYAASAFKLEREREHAWRTTQRSEQASKVAGWYGQKVVKKTTGDGRSEARNRAAQRL